MIKHVSFIKSIEKCDFTIDFKSPLISKAQAKNIAEKIRSYSGKFGLINEASVIRAIKPELVNTPAFINDCSEEDQKKATMQVAIAFIYGVPFYGDVKPGKFQDFDLETLF